MIRAFINVELILVKFFSDHYKLNISIIIYN